MGLFDRFKKKAEELINTISSGIESLIKREEQIEKVSVIPTAPIDTGINTTTAVKESVQETPAKATPVAPEAPKAPVVDKNAHLTFFENPEYISDLAKMKDLMKNRNLDTLESDESQLITRSMRNMENSLLHKSSFINDVKYNAKLEELRNINTAYSNKIQTMRNENELAQKIVGETMLLGNKNTLPLDEGSLLHKISSWNRLKNEVDRYKDHYEFYSEKDEAIIRQTQADVIDNKYITCAKLISAETNLSRLNLDDYKTLQKIKDEFDIHGLNGPTFKNVLEGVAAYREFSTFEDNFKTPRMAGTAESFKQMGQEFEKIAVSLKETGNIPQLEKGFNLFRDFDEIDAKRKARMDAPKLPKATLY